MTMPLALLAAVLAAHAGPPDAPDPDPDELPRGVSCADLDRFPPAPVVEQALAFSTACRGVLTWQAACWSLRAGGWPGRCRCERLLAELNDRRGPWEELRDARKEGESEAFRLWSVANLRAKLAAWQWATGTLPPPWPEGLFP